PQEKSWWENATGFFSDPQLTGYLSSERFVGYVRAALARVAPIAASVFTGVYSGIVAVIVGLAAAAMVVMYLFFILKDYEKVSSGWQQLIPPEQREFIIGFVSDFNVYMNRYFRNQAIIAFFSTVIMSAGFSLIGLPMGILLGIFCGVLSMVPYLQAVGFVPAALLALICALDTGVSFWWVAGEVALVFIVAQLAYDLVLGPRFMGEATGLSPAIILLSLSVWGKFLGLLGFLIALPMTCLLLAYYQRLIARPAEVAPAPPAPPAPATAPQPQKGAPHARP
ncbi:MAG: AI-2E family transporter, partial [Planctomycetes bacterium]|nr:AI-2E family transporter [Planctomycetota bacterium]